MSKTALRASSLRPPFMRITASRQVKRRLELASSGQRVGELNPGCLVIGIVFDPSPDRVEVVAPSRRHSSGSLQTFHVGCRYEPAECDKRSFMIALGQLQARKGRTRFLVVGFLIEHLPIEPLRFEDITGKRRVASPGRPGYRVGSAGSARASRRVPFWVSHRRSG